MHGRNFVSHLGRVEVHATLPIHFIRRVTNAAEYDPLFARALDERLALMAAQRVTGKSSYVDKAAALYRAALADAYAVNALDYGTPEGQQREDALDVRLGGGEGTWRSTF